MLLLIFLTNFSFSSHDANYANYVVKINNPQIEAFNAFVDREQYTVEAFRYHYNVFTLFKIFGDREIIVKEETVNSILDYESCHVSPVKSVVYSM